MIIIALSNRHPVELTVPPFLDQPAYSFTMPFWYFMFGALIVGVLLGGISTWISQGRWRKTARRRTREAHEWRARADQLSEQLKLAQQEFNDFQQKHLDQRERSAAPLNASAPRLTAH